MSDIDKTIADLTKRVDDLASKDMDRRVANLVAEGITKWERSRGALALIVLGVVGLATLNQVSQRIADYFTRSVVKQIDAEVKRKTASISVQDPAIAELTTRTAELQGAVAQLGKATTLPIAPKVASGSAFFGIRSIDGTWSERYFDIAAGGSREPKPGDEVTALGSVNVRSGYIVYGPSGWINQRAIGVLRSGDKVKVVEAKEVVGGFWWVSFVR